MHYILVDMDDTLCMYKQAYENALIQNPLIRYPQSQYSFFTSLRPMPGGIYFLNALLARFECDIQIVTRPSTKNLMSYTEKASWVKQYMGQEWVERLNFINDKTRFDGDFLIDDKEWLGFKGEVIVFNASGERELTEWKRVYVKLAQQLKPRIQ
jgi:5'-nucleotidase